MSNLNPSVIAWWLFGTSLGFSIAGLFGASIGLAVTTGITLVADFVEYYRG